MEQLAVGMMIADPELHARVLDALADLPACVVMELPDVGTAEEAFIESEAVRTDPDVVLLEIAAVGERFPTLIRLVRSVLFPPAVIAIHPTADPDVLLSAMRAGASDCLYLPLNQAALRQVVDRVAAERQRTQPRRLPAKGVGFLSAAGGCGGTTLACHFASELARVSEQRILLADFDLLAGMVGFWTKSANGYSILDAARGLQRLDFSMWRGLVTTLQHHLDVVSAPAEIQTDGQCDPDKLLKVMRFARSHYDWVVADLGPGLTPLSARLLCELNAVFVVSTAEVSVLYQSRRILHKLLGIGYPQFRARLVLSRVHKRQQIAPAEIERALGWRIDAILPYDLTEVEDAQAEGQLISRKSELGKRVTELATRFASEQLEQADDWRLPVARASAPTKALRKAL